MQTPVLFESVFSLARSATGSPRTPPPSAGANDPPTNYVVIDFQETAALSCLVQSLDVNPAPSRETTPTDEAVSVSPTIIDLFELELPHVTFLLAWRALLQNDRIKQLPWS